MKLVHVIFLEVIFQIILLNIVSKTLRWLVTPEHTEVAEYSG